MEIANEIRRQLGSQALFMIGAKNIMGYKNGLCFKIGRNTKNINFIDIKLNGSDTYDLTFYNLRGLAKLKMINQVNNIYVDQLHTCIEDNTGLYTSL